MQVDYFDGVQMFLVFSLFIEFFFPDCSLCNIFLIYKLYHLGFFHTVRIIE